MPIIEPEVSIKSPDKAGAEAILRTELTRKLDALPPGRQVMLKLTIPDVPDFYSALINHSVWPGWWRSRAATPGPTRVDGSRPITA